MGKKKSFLYRLEYKLGRFAVPNLMLLIIGGMVIVYIADLCLSSMGLSLSSWIWFDRAAVLRGEVWRVFTFIFLPPDSSLLFIALSLYFYFILGRALEQEWGAFRFNLFYLCGFIGSLAAGFLTGFATNGYLNMSLFLAFAILYPDYEFLIFFILPVKAKYLALIDAILYALSFIFGDWSILATKAVLDLIIVLVMTCSMGKGCIFSAIPVFVFQGVMTVLARLIRPLMTEAALGNLSLVGSILIFCVGVNLVWGKKLRVANMLPAVVFAGIAAFV